ncbi:hypothetical protein [Nocardioides sp.]|uniref:hypothetical protein n=1 Tax=Nocardioides sp. TaxID=35761 RepID=UPI003D0A3BB5
MSTPTDLRSVLEEHAHDIETIPTGDRLSQVQGRIRGVRRRRRAAMAGAAAVVVAVAGVVTFLPRDPEAAPASRDLAGHTAPKTLQSLGYTYTFADGDQGRGEAVVRLSPSDQPRLYAWASDTGSLQGRDPGDLDGDGSSPDTVELGAEDFADFHEIPPGVSGVLRATGPGQVGLAVYTLSAPAPGVTKDGTTFRADVAGDRLLEAAIGDRGQNDLTVRFAMPQRDLRMSEVCSGLSDKFQVNVEINGALVTFGQCSGSTPLDGGSGYSTFTGGIADRKGDRVRPGDPVTARIWVTRESGRDDPSPEAVSAPGVHLGAAFYEVAPTVAVVAGWDLPAQVEYDGHLWTWFDSTSLVATLGPAALDVDADPGPVLAQTMSKGNFRVTVPSFVDGKVASRNSGGGLGVVRMFEGGQHTVAIDGVRLGPRGEVGVALYRRG